MAYQYGYEFDTEQLEDGTRITYYNERYYKLEKQTIRERIEPNGTINRYYKNGNREYTKLPDGTELSWFDNGEKASEKLPDGTERKWWKSGKHWWTGKSVDHHMEYEKLPDGTERKWTYPHGKKGYEKLPDGTEREWFDDGAPKFEKLPDGTVSKGYYIPQPNAVYIHEVYHVWETTYAHPIGRMTRNTGGNYDVYDKARYGFRKEEEFFNGVIQSKTIYIDGNQTGFVKYRDGKVLMSEMTYRGKNEKHYYNSNGKEISEESFNLMETKRKKIRERNKKIASIRIAEEKQIEAETGSKTRLPKMSDFEKTVAIIKENLGLLK